MCCCNLFSSFTAQKLHTETILSRYVGGYHHTSALEWRRVYIITGLKANIDLWKVFSDFIIENYCNLKIGAPWEVEDDSSRQVLYDHQGYNNWTHSVSGSFCMLHLCPSMPLGLLLFKKNIMVKYIHSSSEKMSSVSPQMKGTAWYLLFSLIAMLVSKKMKTRRLKD